MLDGLQAVARFLYVHSPALTLKLLPPTEKGTVKFAFELTEPGLPEVIQAYEVSMAVAARIVHLLGGPGGAAEERVVHARSTGSR